MALSKEERIQQEYERLAVVYSTVEGNARIVIEQLLQNSAFLAITLQDLQRSINSKGTTDAYQNGQNQYGTKASAELQAYNQTLKSYDIVQRQLLKLIPERQERNTLAEILAAVEKETA